MPTKPKHSQPDWPHHVQSFNDSGLSRAEYCRQTGLDYDQLGYYARKFNTDTQSTVKPDYSVDIDRQYALSDFVPITRSCRTQNQKSEFTLTQNDGGTLCWSADWSPQQVLEFVTAWNAKC